LPPKKSDKNIFKKSNDIRRHSFIFNKTEDIERNSVLTNRSIDKSLNNLTNRSIDKSINNGYDTNRSLLSQRNNMSMTYNPTNKNKSIDEMNLDELNNALDTPQTGMHFNKWNMNSSVSKSQTFSQKNNIHKIKPEINLKMPEATKLNSGRNSMLDKKYNFSKNTIEDKLNRLDTTSSNRNS